MRETLEQIYSHLWMIMHHRWIALTGAILICAGGWPAVQLIPDQFEVEAQVYLDNETVLKPLLQGLAVDNTVREQSAQLMRSTLITRPNIEQVIREVDLDLTVKTPEEMDLLIRDMSEAMEISTVEVEKRRIHGRQPEDSSIYRIAYQHSDPQLAKRVVEVLLNIFVERVLGKSRKDTTSAHQFLDQQITDYRQKLEVAEDRLKQFKLEHAGLMPEDGSTYTSRVNDLQTQIGEAQLQLAENENKAQVLREQLQSMREAASASQGAETAAVPATELYERIATLEKNLSELTMQFTDAHPDVITTRRALAELYEQRKALGDASPGAATQQEVLGSSSFQDITVLLSEAEGEVAALRARVQEYQRRIADMQPMLSKIPQVEAELAKLDRDYEIIKTTYEQLVERRESAEISEQAQRSNDEMQFRIIEPPVVPLTPKSPDRIRLVSLVLVAALFGGAGLAWLFAQLKPTFYSRKQIMSLFDIPVLGSVSMQWTAGERAKRRVELAVFACVCTLLITAYSGLIVIDVMDIDVMSKLKAVKERVL
jgi:polysaccharide chain length determinant protein (PEP-CTERM system associated)